MGYTIGTLRLWQFKKKKKEEKTNFKSNCPLILLGVSMEKWILTVVEKMALVSRVVLFMVPSSPLLCLTTYPQEEFSTLGQFNTLSLTTSLMSKGVRLLWPSSLVH